MSTAIESRGAMICKVMERNSAVGPFVGLGGLPLSVAVWRLGPDLAVEYSLSQSSPQDIASATVSVALFLLGLSLGGIIQDWFSKSSWFKGVIQDWKNCFTVEFAGYPSPHVEGLDWTILRVKLRYSRRCRPEISVRVVANVGQPPEKTFVLSGLWEAKNGVQEKDSFVELDLASIPRKPYDGKPAGYQTWGGELRRTHVDGQEPFWPGRHVVEITARTWRGVQRQKFLVVWPNLESHGFGRDVLIGGELIEVIYGE